MKTENKKLMFASDYQEGAHPNIINRLIDTNRISMPGYGTDSICQSAKDRIRKACDCPKAAVEFLIGGTQVNATCIGSLLRTYQGVLAADSGHIAVHEAGAIEFGGHKVLTLPSSHGKITARQINRYITNFYLDENHDHMVMPGMVYISQPTEFGTLYNKEELTRISNVCHAHHIPLYIDGARLAYALAAPENDVTLKDLTSLSDIFYIGGTKCGALFGEAVVIPNPDLIPHFITIIKQHGALLAKGRILGIQFDELFKEDLYLQIGKPAIQYASQIKNTLNNSGFKLYLDAPTNQIFFIIENEKMRVLSMKVAYSYWESYDKTHTVIRLATSWATQADDVKQLCEWIQQLKRTEV